jgi:hypothetical protein
MELLDLTSSKRRQLVMTGQLHDRCMGRRPSAVGRNGIDPSAIRFALPFILRLK